MARQAPSLMTRYQSTPQPFNRLEPVDAPAESQKPVQNNLSSEAIQRMIGAAKSMSRGSRGSSGGINTPELKHAKENTPMIQLPPSP